MSDIWPEVGQKNGLISDMAIYLIICINKLTNGTKNRAKNGLITDLGLYQMAI